LARPAGWRARTTARTHRSRRRQTGADAQRARSSRHRARGMHGSPFSRTHRGTRPTRSGRPLRTRTLENRLTWHGTSRCRTHGSWRARLRRRCNGTRRRSFVNGPRAGLRNDHPRRWRLWRRRLRGSRRSRRRGRFRSSRRGLRSGRGRHGWRGYSRRRRHRACGHRRYGWTHWCRDRRRGSCNRLFDWRRHDRPHRRRGQGRRRRSCGSSRRLRRRRRCRHWLWRNWRYRRTNRRSRSSFLLLCDRLQHIARSGDVRQINLGLDFFFAAQRARSFPGG